MRALLLSIAVFGTGVALGLSATAKAVTFSDAVNVPSTFGPDEVVAADFNSDGDLDLVAGGFESYAIHLGSAGAAFGNPTELPTTALFLEEVAVADFNQDGDPDIAMLNNGPQHTGVAVYLGGPGATFQPPATIAVGTIPVSIVSDDFNGDEDPD